MITSGAENVPDTKGNLSLSGSSPPEAYVLDNTTTTSTTMFRISPDRWISQDIRPKPSAAKSRRTMVKDYQVLLFIFIIGISRTSCQTYRRFPSLFNLAKYKALSTDPSQSTCGLETRVNAYCRSSPYSSSVDECRQDYCFQKCPGRTSLPPSYDLLKASNYGTCVTTDTDHLRPGSKPSSFAAVFIDGASCTLYPLDQLVVGANGAFTLTFWIWQNANNIGTIIEKYTSSSETIFRLRVSSRSLFFLYRTNFGLREVQVSDVIPSQAWNFIAIQVYDNTMSYFINGTSVGVSARGTYSLVGAVRDGSGIVKLGQTSKGTDQYVGLIQDPAFYPVTLTNREIDEVYSGQLPEVFIQTACRCPATHPRVKPGQTHFCIRNGLPDNNGDEVRRLGNDSHPLQYVADEDVNSMWISTFLDDVTITVNLADQFQVFYVVLQFYSPMPKVVTIERRKDIQSPWQPWQYYAEDCQLAFNKLNNGPLTTATDVNCLQFGTNGLIVPYSKGNITFSVLSPEPQPRPGYNEFYKTPELGQFVLASQVRVRLQDHFYVKQPRHKYYGIYEFIVTGRCDCHGHAAECLTTSLPYKCLCSAESNTEGRNCERCKPLYNDKPYRDGNQIQPYNCKPCECHNHADSCKYDITVDPYPLEHDRGGGGVCVNCKHNTTGRHCDQCKQYYYRPLEKSLYDEDVCSECQCFSAGVIGDNLDCEKTGGQCRCKTWVTGRQCDRCLPGYFNLQASNPMGCEQCQCNSEGTITGNTTCHPLTGQCYCKQNVRNDKCDACQYGYYGLSASDPLGCSPCNCHPAGSLNLFCNPESGQCTCQSNRQGRQCDQCADGFYNFEAGCLPCDCNPAGSQSGGMCDKVTGQCLCKRYVTGIHCDQCADGYYNLGADFSNGCLNCGCYEPGTRNDSLICSKLTGDCDCKANVQGRSCNQCKPNTYNLTADNEDGCQVCGCDPSGTSQGSMLVPFQVTCDQNTGQCTCLSNRIGLKCDQCARGYYKNLTAGGGCNPCDCDPSGRIPATSCDPETGQCHCKQAGAGIGGRRCDRCLPGYYGFTRGRCTPCECDISGSINITICDFITGQCQCKQFTRGRQCGQCVPGTSNLQAVNPFGCSKDPDQQPPPEHQVLNTTALRLFWDPPDYPNGIIQKYVLYRDNAVIATLDADRREFNDTNLTPFTEYTYYIVAYNDYGTTTSPSVTFRTPPGPPSGSITLSVSDVTSQSASFTWTSPPASNGILQYYQLNATVYNQSEPEVFYQGLSLRTVVSTLKPYMYYEFYVTACTKGGCLVSPGVPVITKEALPEGQQPPTITPLSSSELLVSWNPPEKPNGVIIFYELWMRGELNAVGMRDPPNTRIFHPAGYYDPLNLPRSQPLAPPSTSYTVRNLDPYKQYEFQVISQNSLGLAASTWTTARTGESAPTFMPSPVIEPLSATSLNVTWVPPSPSQAHGDIILYRLYHNKQLNLDNNPYAPPSIWQVIRMAEGDTLSALVTDLAPYSEQTFIVEACNNVGCINSSESTGKTLPGVPSDVPEVSVDGYNSTTMYLSWEAPLKPNGPNPYYVVRRREVALNKPPPQTSRGTRFTGTGYHLFPPETIPYGVGFTGIQLEFKTHQREGLLLFAASEGGQEEFLAIQLRAGRPWFLYDPQGCRTFVTLDLNDNFDVTMFDENGKMRENITFNGITFDDGRWYHLLARRRINNASLSIDDRYIGEKESECTTGNIIGRNTGVYIGGIPDDYILERKETDDRAQVNDHNFQGCIRNIQILTQVVPEEVWTPLNWSTAIERYSSAPYWQGCPDNLEPEESVHYLGTGYVEYTPAFMYEFSRSRKIPPHLKFSLRTEERTGMLFFGYGPVGYYHLIQVIDGNLVWMTGTPSVRRRVVFPNTTVNICDGMWHELRLEKVRALMTIEVDDESVKDGDPAEPFSAQNAITLSSNMFAGGLPDEDEVKQAVRDNNLQDVIVKNFGGCMKYIKSNNKAAQIVKAVDVYLDGCPSPGENIPTCQFADFVTIYNGTDNYTLDTNLDPFTEYIYQVEVHNSAGYNYSRWYTGRTREGPPNGVSGPFGVMVLNGFTIKAQWRRPTGHTGQITSYKLKAVDRDNNTADPVTATFSPETYSGQITDAVPYTNYTLYLVACTAGGCTTSTDGVQLTTNEEAPSGVMAPVSIDAGATYINVGWTPPAHPNGILTGYVLYMEGREIYAGAMLSYNVTGLQVFNTYRFFIQACSRMGCTDSDTASLTTKQLPPTSVAPPKLSVKGSHMISVEWSLPDQLNGVLERFLLYASTVPDNVGDVVYNSSTSFLKYDIPELLAGTVYYVRVMACTGGGCTVSNPSSAVTFESAPEGLKDPVIEAISPTSLHISWSPPQYPNGVITQYRLYQNGLLVLSNSTVLEYTVDNLQPWSLHLFRVEACTVKGCTSTSEVSARTQEAPPVGNIGLDLTVKGPRSVSLLWNSVDQANGAVSYDAYFEGIFYVDPDFSNYNTQTERRRLLTTEEAGTWKSVDGLIPYTVYYVQINASNTAGYLLSNVKQAVMPQGSPDGVYPPQLTSPSPDSVKVDWRPAARSNADVEPTFQLQFKENRSNAAIIDLFSQPTTSNTYLKTGLQPFTEYQFRVVAINPYGKTQSEWVSITTRQDVPEGVDPPKAYNISTHSVTLEWDPPLTPNGIIIEYKIYKNGAELISVDGNQTTVFVDDLMPFSRYTFQLSACTLAGCTQSESSQEVYTLQAVPDGIPKPSLVSQTPTSILIVWSEPEFTNGVILQYGVERRLDGSTEPILIHTSLATDPKQYLDQSAQVMPFTSYEYRITAENAVGKAEGPWASVTTKPSRPGGVQSPVVHVLSPTSLEIQWSEPIQPNGVLESYVIALPEPRFEVTNTSQLSLTVDNLTPYTNYSITVTACSDGGCTKSQPTLVSTSPAAPQGQPAPVGTPISQTYISVLWKPPAKPNGPEIRYELARMKVAQPLEPYATDFGLWTSLYLGTNTYYDDRELTIYTTYRYRVTVYNAFGHTISDPSDDVTTFGGTPTKPPVITLSPVNHTAFMVTWKTPTLQELQGGVSKYTVTVMNGNSSVDYDVATVDHAFTVTGLTPNTEYKVTVTLEVHGGATATSDIAVITTPDGAPEGLPAPYKSVINQTTVRISWSAPSKPNGDIKGYYLYVNDRQIDTGQNTPGSYLLTNLQPYTIYKIQVEVCTVYACVRSPAINVTTAETVPAGVLPPTLNVVSPHVINATWQPPAEPNGIILRYELLRKSKIPCTDVIKPPQEPSTGRCIYIECGVLESFCGNQCYSGPKTCCDGVVYDNIQGYECCGTSYIPQRQNADDVCCGGHFYTQLTNHVCCAGRYVEVLPGQICCPDPTEDRVDIGHGDRCCASVPYMADGAQICCNGMLFDGYRLQCCGGHIIDNDLQCCGNATWGQAYAVNTSNTCCGEEYVPKDRSLCCGDPVEGYKAHVYETSDVMITANEKCCSKNVISSNLRCCNGNGFNPFTQFCADISTMESGCGTGVICPVEQEGTAYCNRCNFDQSSYKCGSYTTQRSTSPTYSKISQLQNEDKLCETIPVKVYTGMDLQYTDQGLRPYTEYHYALVVINTVGSTKSDFTFATTSPALPEGVTEPVAEVRPDQLDTIYLTWKTPDKPNGIITAYVLFRDGIEIFRDPNTKEYRDNNAILPYQTYRYKLQVCNSAGCVSSDEIQVSTLQAKPEQVAPPVVTADSPTSLQVSWTTPGRPNGQIIKYVLYELTTLGTVLKSEGLVNNYMLEDLKPYTTYKLLISACTAVGCTNSTATSASTLQDKPQGLDVVRTVIINQTTAELYWSEPSEPNGVITGYTLYLSDNGLVFESKYKGGMLNYTATSLRPNINYWNKVAAETIAGSSEGPVSSFAMPQMTPEGIGPPINVTVLGPEAMYVEWAEPEVANGVIDQYRVLLNGGTEGEIAQGFGLSLNGRIDGLEPYSLYEVRVQACLRGVVGGCGTGPGVVVRTWEAPPDGQDPPQLVARSSDVVQLTWEPPERANGVITGYRIRRRLANSSSEILIAVVAGDAREFVNTAPELRPYTRYQYAITATNSQGEVSSDWASVLTLEATPETMRPPVLSDVDAHSATVSWQPPFSANGVIRSYEVEYRSSADPASGVFQSVTLPGDVLSTSVSGLTPYTTYSFRVTASNSVGSTSSTWAVTTTGQAAPAEMGQFRVEKIPTGTSLILNWPVPGKPNGVINNYLVYEAGNANAVYQGLNREFEYRRLEPFTEYTVQLEACTVGGCARSREQKVRTAEVAPGSQPAPTVGDLNSTSVTLYWTAPRQANGRIISYEVLRRVIGRRQRRDLPEPVVVYKTVDSDRETYNYTDADLEPFTAYEYRIRTTNSAGYVISDPLRVETPPSAPAGLAPPTVTQIPNKPDQLRVAWSAPDKPNGILSNYQLQRNDSTPWSFDPDVARVFVDTGLKAHTYYSYKVTACNQGGCTPSDPTVVLTSEAEPSFVEPPQLAAVNSTAIRVTWTAPTVINGDISEYRLFIDDRLAYKGLATFYTAGELQPFRAYTFVLMACTSGGCTNSSSVIGRPTEDAPAGMQPPALQVTSSTSIEVTWRQPTEPNGVITSYELRRDDDLIYTTSQLQYVDYDLAPGTTYTYTVTAYNSRGSTTSVAASATTYSSSPVGLAPPELTALSSTSVKAEWSPPLQPNGQIKNYTLYEGTKSVYSDLQLNTVVQNLSYWTEYTFRVKACTDSGCALSDAAKVRTLEAIPEALDGVTLTPLADSTGAHSGVLIQWQPPRRPNGVITKYEIYRRPYKSDDAGGFGELIYSGDMQEYTDVDPDLKPYTLYQYRVVAYNSVGQVTSDWYVTRTNEAPPTGVLPPVVKSTTPTSISVQLQKPEQPNGNINSYTVFLNGKEVVHRLSLFIIIGTNNPLTPYTKYTIYIEACTAGGCTPSPSVETRTKPALPEGLSEPTVINITSDSVDVVWEPPTKPNGPIRAYTLSMRMICPYPYADPSDALIYPCLPSAWVTKTRGGSLSAHVTGLTPYTRYQFKLEVENIVGTISQVIETVTKAAPPKYSGVQLKIHTTGGSISVDWTESFHINGEVEEFVFYKNGTVEFRGSALSYSVLRTDLYAKYSFQVKLFTTEGQAQTPIIFFDPTEGGVIEPQTTAAPVAVASVPVYEEVWFIALMAILALIIIFICIAVCFGMYWHRKVPYIRERMPLPPRQKKADVPLAYVMEPYDRNIPPSEVLSADQVAQTITSNNTVSHVGYINPAYSHLSIPSHPASLVDLNLDQLSEKSIWDNDDNSLWDGHAGGDSGLHSLAYGDDYDADSDRPVSVLKEHTMFTDTHV